MNFQNEYLGTKYFVLSLKMVNIILLYVIRLSVALVLTVQVIKTEFVLRIWLKMCRLLKLNFLKRYTRVSQNKCFKYFKVNTCLSDMVRALSYTVVIIFRFVLQTHNSGAYSVLDCPKYQNTSDFLKMVPDWNIKFRNRLYVLK